ncbi:MAG: zinc ABC transporter substrate-binding protein [Pararhodobacter sp.]
MLRPILLTLLTAVPAYAQAPRVVTDLPVTHSLVAQVMGDLGTPGVLLERGGDPHHAQLRPSQARALAGADLVVWIGAGLSPWLEGPVGTLATGQVLDLGALDGLHRRDYGQDGAAGGHAEAHGHDDHGHDDHAHDDHAHDDHAHDDHSHDDHGHDDHAHDDHAHDDHAHDDHGHDDHAHDDHGQDGHGHDDHAHDDHAHDEHAHHDHAHHDHSHTGTDPHFWLDPQNAVLWLEAIAATLSAQDPGNATLYTANAVTAAEDIRSLQAELALILAPAGDTGLVMFHDAYGYFAETFGLTVLGTVTGGDAAAPGAARLAGLRAQLAGAGALCLFPEANHPDDFVRVVAEGTDLRIGAPLDPAGVTLEPGPDLYATLLRGLAQSIADCVAG